MHNKTSSDGNLFVHITITKSQSFKTIIINIICLISMCRQRYRYRPRHRHRHRHRHLWHEWFHIAFPMNILCIYFKNIRYLIWKKRLYEKNYLWRILDIRYEVEVYLKCDKGKRLCTFDTLWKDTNCLMNS